MLKRTRRERIDRLLTRRELAAVQGGGDAANDQVGYSFSKIAISNLAKKQGVDDWEKRV